MFFYPFFSSGNLTPSLQVCSLRPFTGGQIRWFLRFPCLRSSYPFYARLTLPMHTRFSPLFRLFRANLRSPLPSEDFPVSISPGLSMMPPLPLDCSLSGFLLCASQRPNLEEVPQSYASSTPPLILFRRAALLICLSFSPWIGLILAIP